MLTTGQCRSGQTKQANVASMCGEKEGVRNAFPTYKVDRQMAYQIDGFGKGCRTQERFRGKNGRTKSSDILSLGATLPTKTYLLMRLLKH